MTKSETTEDGNISSITLSWIGNLAPSAFTHSLTVSMILSFVPKTHEITLTWYWRSTEGTAVQYNDREKYHCITRLWLVVVSLHVIRLRSKSDHGPHCRNSQRSKGRSHSRGKRKRQQQGHRWRTTSYN